MKSAPLHRLAALALRPRVSCVALGLLLSLHSLSCDRSAKAQVDSKPSHASTQESRLRSAQESSNGKETVLKTLKRSGSGKAFPQLASDIRQMLKSGNRAAFDELIGSLSELEAWDHNFGIEIMRDLDPSLAPLAMEWLSSIPDPTLRYHTKSGALGQWIARDPLPALKLLASLDDSEKTAADPSIQGEVKPVTSFERQVWSSVGTAIGDPTMDPATKDSILKAVAGLSPEMLEAYRFGVAGSAVRSVRKEMPVNYAELTQGLDTKGVALLVADMAVESSGIYKHPSSVRELLGYMDSLDADLAGTYAQVGAAFDFDSFPAELLEKEDLSGEARAALVKGWSGQRPEDAVKLLAGKYPDLLAPAFKGWLEKDRQAAETWLRGSEPGTTKTTGVKQICDFLVKTGQTDELANWIDLLPAADRASYQDAPGPR
ncbi:hypothetical protein [Haloferula sp. BvORR071]|uniref:hypothetical protein n=1 Tax=Haloferula sp. BvORR071 TaxID=1396141 RepID=UPI002240EDAD|nr:hypothetical protein [Haloferula sp. BvORR071]